MMERIQKASGPIASLVAAAALLGLLHRSLGRAGASRAFRLGPESLLVGFVRDFGPPEWVLILGTCVACIVAVAKREPGRLLRIQMWSLAGGLLLTHFALGSEVGEKVDPRFVFTLIAGAASLHCCYVCLLAYVAMAFGRRAV